MRARYSGSEPEEIFFPEYNGAIKWMQPYRFFREPWAYMATMEADNGKEYDIVIGTRRPEVRCTLIEEGNRYAGMQ
ncbi:MAG: hypothetical protein K5637_01820 [Lachnospiraceae bacterium]|nr:hypothetical protein [Lachnospiraceae bacterium]